ncbi:MAG: exodeoxyribonuclease VII small subunit [Tannerellaceae bacterium]|nr:exodeoxyribonuclease VII small subunit [Tannerellaceae bacterium]
METNGESYNEAMAKLNKIMAELKDESIDVDVLLDKVKEAARLIKLCKKKLFKVDEEVNKVLKELEA